MQKTGRALGSPFRLICYPAVIIVVRFEHQSVFTALTEFGAKLTAFSRGILSLGTSENTLDRFHFNSCIVLALGEECGVMQQRVEF